MNSGNVTQLKMPPGVYIVSPYMTNAATVRVVYGVDVVMIVRDFPYFASYAALGLDRPLIWSNTVH